MSLPIAIIDARAPTQAKEQLQKSFLLIEFLAKDIGYESLRGHPDVFMCTTDTKKLIIAPNTPEEIKHIFSKHTISYTEGNTTVDKDIQSSTAYNCIINKKYIFHKQSHTDPIIRTTFSNKKNIELPQAFSRCNMLCLPDGACITSDRGILKVLKTENIPHIYCSPKNILLPPYKHGCIGGTMGIYKNTVYIIGSLQTLDNGNDIKQFIHEHTCRHIELYGGALYDGGGIFFFE